MKFVLHTLTTCFFIILTLTCWPSGSTEAQNRSMVSSSNTGNLKNGALLYDNWLEVSHTQLSMTNPGYPSSSKKSGKNTWRCKECHGWDYIGHKGRYKKGSHYTGIDGLYDSRHKERKYLLDALNSDAPGHDFTPYLNDLQRADLVRFIRHGQIDVNACINPQGRAKGSAPHGKSLYDAQCARCHGSNGIKIDFKSKKPGLQGVGWLATDNPQETLHKIRWGHPGSDMPSMIVDALLSDSQTVDILTYGQTLPNKVNEARPTRRE